MQSEELDLSAVQKEYVLRCRNFRLWNVPCQSGLPIFLLLSFFLEMQEVALAIQRPDYSTWLGLLHGCRIAATLAPNCAAYVLHSSEPELQQYSLEPTYLKNTCAAYVPCSPVVQMNPKARHQTQQQH